MPWTPPRAPTRYETSEDLHDRLRSLIDSSGLALAVPTHRDTNPSESLNNPPTSKIDSFGGRDGWLQDARQRADEFHRGGPRAPTTWVLTSGHEIPPLAVEAGKEGDNMLYVARSYVEV